MKASRAPTRCRPKPQHTVISMPATVSAGQTQRLRIPADPARVGIQAVGLTGLLGAVVDLQ